MTCLTHLRSNVVVALVLCAGSVLAADAEDKARAHFRAAQSAYDLARFEEALEGYSEAYRLMNHPAFLFNIAQCHRQLGNFERAAFFYRRYLALSSSKPANAKVVQELIDEMDQKQVQLDKRRQDEDDATRRREEQQRLAQQQAEKQRAAEQNVARSLTTQVPAGPPPSDEGTVFGKWWFWTGVGVLAAAGTAAYVVTAPQARPTSLEGINAR